MAVALSTIRNQVRSYLDEASPADWTNAELNTYINQRYHRVYTAAITVFEEYNITTATADTVADQQEYGLPSDFYKMRRVEINYDVDSSNSRPTRAFPKNIDIVRRDLSDTNLGPTISSGAFYYITGDEIGFLPIPDKAGTNAIRIWYVKQITDLSDDTDTIEIPYSERYWNLIAEGAASDALRQGQQDLRAAQDFDAKFVAGILLMQEELEDRVAEETKSIIDTSGQFLDFTETYY